MKNIFLLLYSLAKGLLIIPNSNAEPEQLLSRLALFKTKFKSKLNGETLNSVFMVNSNHNSKKFCHDFKPTKSVIGRAKKSKYYITRRVWVRPDILDKKAGSLHAPLQQAV